VGGCLATIQTTKQRHSGQFMLAPVSMMHLTIDVNLLDVRCFRRGGQMNIKTLLVACVASIAFVFAQQNATSGIKISVYPNPVYIEKLESGQSVAADFGIEKGPFFGFQWLYSEAASQEKAAQLIP